MFERSGEAILEGESFERFPTADLEFHRVSVVVAGNRLPGKIVSDTRLLVRVFTSTFWRYDRDKLRLANRFHKRLLGAVAARDTKAARAATIAAKQVAKGNAQEA